MSVQLDLCDTVMEIKDMLGSPNCELVSASNRRTLVDSETSKEVIPNDSVLFLVPGLLRLLPAYLYVIVMASQLIQRRQKLILIACS